jgi:uncharacterized membrane protein YgcG
MKLLQVQAFACLFLAALLSVPAWGNTANTNSAVPGTLNYVEGQAYLADQPLDHNSVGKTTLEVGQSLRTEAGKAEILLTPGVFLREGENTSIELVAAGLANTEVRLTHGHVMVEVDQIFDENDLRVVEGDATARIVKPGLYDFNLQQNQIRVFDGEATVQYAGKEIKLKSGHDLVVAENARSAKSEKFDKKALTGDDLYRWSSLRSDYVAEANVDAAQTVVTDGWLGAGYWGAGWGGWGWGWGGWYWDPWFSAFTFIPHGGIFYSPFGWGFYSPGLVFRAPFYGGHFHHEFNARNVRAWGAGQHYATNHGYAHGVYTGAGAARGAFHSGTAMAHGGGGGGFHGGGGGGYGGGGGSHGGGGGHGR